MVRRVAGRGKTGLWLLALLAALTCVPPARAEAVGPPATTPARAAFELEIDAPPEIADYLGRHLELQRYRELTDLEDEELRRLLVAAERNARDLLGTLGYFSPAIRLEQRDAAPDPAASRRVRLQVEPGTPARIGEVRIRFSGPIDSDDTARAQRAAIRAGWLLRPGQRFTQADWDDAKAQALRQLTAQRYPAGELRDSLADVDPETATVHLSLTLDSGPLYRLGELAISGSERYDPALVRRLARLAPGADYNQRELLDAQQRLADSGYFDAVFVSLDTAADPAAAPVRVQLREARLQKLVLGIGASTDSGGRLSAEHTHHRLPGLGWRAVSRLALDREKRTLGATLTAPPDTDNWRWMTSALVQHEQAASYTISSQRLRAGRTQTGERIDRNLYLQFDRARTTGNASSVLADALSANYAWTQRNFDSLPFPADGHGLGVELGGGLTLGSRNEPFARGVLRWLGYWPLARGERSQRPLARAGRLVVRAEAGAVLAREGVALPATQLFLTGGDTSVRGYSLHDIGVVQPSGAVAPGRYLAVGSMEWQRPILAGNRPSDWEGTVFLDAGAVADKPGDLRPKVGVGVGARWKSPVGPLQIDLAYGVDVKRFRLHLNVGFTF